MGGNQGQFLYSIEQIARLEQTLSPDRLNPYIALAHGDRQHAIKLYEWNTSLSESFYGVLQGLEIALRNSLHDTLSNAFAAPDWYDQFALEPDQQRTLQKAKQRIIRDGKMINPGRVVAELSFGFWVSILGPAYAQTLWDKYLYSAFRFPMKRKTVHLRLDGIRKLRNRVAHHESILGRNLKNDF